MFRQLLAEPLEDRSLLAAVLTSQSFFGGAGNQRGTAIAINAGDIYLTGNNPAPEGQGSSQNGLVLKYATPTSSGASPVWSRSFDFGTAFFGVAATNEGVYPVGWNYTLSSDGAGGKEVKGIATKFATDGSAGGGPGGSLWVNTPNIYNYQGVEAFNAATAADVSGTTYVYAAGQAQPASYSAYTIAKYGTAGGPLVVTTDPHNPLPGSFVPNFSSAAGVTFLSGNVYAAGTTSYGEGTYFIRPALWKHPLCHND